MVKYNTIGIVGALLALNVAVGLLLVGVPGFALADHAPGHEGEHPVNEPPGDVPPVNTPPVETPPVVNAPPGDTPPVNAPPHDVPPGNAPPDDRPPGKN